MSLLDKNRDHVLGLFRVVAGLLFACHGAATLLDVFGGAHGAPPRLWEWPGWWAAVVQLGGGALVLVGFGTRVAALVCSGSMAYAYFSVHQESALLPIENGGEPAALFCWMFLLIAAFGPGAWAVDRAIARSTARAEAPSTRY